MLLSSFMIEDLEHLWFNQHYKIWSCLLALSSLPASQGLWWNACGFVQLKHHSKPPPALYPALTGDVLPSFISMQLLASFSQYLFSLLYCCLAVNASVLPLKCTSSGDGTWSNKFSISNTFGNILPVSECKIPYHGTKVCFLLLLLVSEGWCQDSHVHWTLSAIKDVSLRKDRTKWKAVVMGSDALPVKASACKHRANLLFLFN